MKVMVAGANGFVGAHVVQASVSRGHDVVGACRSGSSQWRLARVDREIRIAHFDICQKDEIACALEYYRPNVVINCIAYGVDNRRNDPDLAFRTNVVGAYDLACACVDIGVERMVHVGSCFEYGSKQHPIRESDSLNPTAMYGATKAAASLILRSLARQLQLQLAIVRPFGVWGPMEEENRLVPQVIRACLERRTLKLTNCRQIRDYTYVRDLANWISQIALQDCFPADDIINLGSGEVTLEDFVREIAAELGGEHLMRFGELPYRDSEMMELTTDTQKMKGLIRNVTYTEVATGIAEMVEAIKA